MDTDAEKSSLGAFERFLYWMFIPFVFTVVCVTVLLSLFDYDVKNQLQRFGHSIPLVGSFIPEPKTAVKSGTGPAAADDKTKQDQDLSSIKQKAANMENQLSTSDAAGRQKDQTIKDLQAKAAGLEEQLKTKTKTDEEYDAQVQQLAATYAKMSPSKAAPLIENLTLKEQVLVLNAMKQDNRVGILEKMDPKKAADASIGLKDVTTAKDKEIAALQERVKLYESAIPKTTQKLTSADVGQTFNNMVSKSAATILLEMQNTNPNKVLDILKATDSQSRAKIMAAVADINKEAAAAISAQLVP